MIFKSKHHWIRQGNCSYKMLTHLRSKAWDQNNKRSIPSVTTSSVSYSDASSAHGGHHSLNFALIEIVPFLLQCLLELVEVLGWTVTGSNLSIQMVPQVFGGRPSVGRVRRPAYHVHSLLFDDKCIRVTCSMRPSIVLLQGEVMLSCVRHFLNSAFLNSMQSHLHCAT